MFIATFVIIMFLNCYLSKRNAVSGCSEKPISKRPISGKPNSKISEGQKGYKVYGYMGCPYTVKQLDLMTSNDIAHTFVPTDTAKGAEEFKTLMKGEKSGVPVTLNMSNNKISKGFTTLDRL